MKFELGELDDVIAYVKEAKADEKHAIVKEALK